MKSLFPLILTALAFSAAPRDGESMAILAYHYAQVKSLKCTPPTAEQEKKLFSEINAQSRQLYNSFDCEGKNRAMLYAEQKCAGDNCKIPQCEGNGTCEFKDKNEAIQQAAKGNASEKDEMMDPRYEDDVNDPQKQMDQYKSDGQKQMEQGGSQNWGY